MRVNDNEQHEKGAVVEMRRQRAEKGWKSEEEQLLWDEVLRARQNSVPLKSVFDAIALKTGRKPNSIRNYYYAQLKQSPHSDLPVPANPAFIPFRQEEIWYLLTNVLGDQAKGISVRACTLRLGNGDNRAMLRYQNKYRSLIKSNPALIQRVIDEMNAKGVPVFDPYAPQPAVRRVGRPRKQVPAGRVAELGEMLASINGFDARAFLDSLAWLVSQAVKTQSDGAKAGVNELNARLQEEIEMLRSRLETQTETLSKTKENYYALMEMFQKLMAVNREFLGFDSMIKISNLNAYIRELSQNIELCEQTIASS